MSTPVSPVHSVRSLSRTTPKWPGPSGDTAPYNSTNGGGAVSTDIAARNGTNPGGASARVTYWSIHTSLRTSSGRRNATSTPTRAPSLQPTRWADSMPSVSMNAIVCRAMFS